MRVPSRKPTERIPDADRLSADLARFWLLSLSRLDWRERLELLEKIDEEIRVVCHFEDIHRQVSQKFTAKMIEGLKGGGITCLEQAYIYLNSAVEVHRNAARAWLVLKRPNSPLLAAQASSQGRPDGEKRAAVRHTVNLPTTIAVNDNHFSGSLVDISLSGAKVAISSNLVKGAIVEVDVPFLGRVAASVVWVAASFVGLAFASQQITALSL
jgi:hypothetical protein